MRANPKVISQRIGDEMILVDTLTERIYSLNTTSAHLWELLKAGRSVEQATADLYATYAVDQGQLQVEVERTVQQLLTEGLILADDD